MYNRDPATQSLSQEPQTLQASDRIGGVIPLVKREEDPGARFLVASKHAQFWFWQGNVWNSSFAQEYKCTFPRVHLRVVPRSVSGCPSASHCHRVNSRLMLLHESHKIYSYLVTQRYACTWKIICDQIQVNGTFSFVSILLHVDNLTVPWSAIRKQDRRLNRAPIPKQLLLIHSVWNAQCTTPQERVATFLCNSMAVTSIALWFRNGYEELQVFLSNWVWT